ncbi:MAG: hypothetical protein JSW49_08175 [candidate division WOR-3 bacterium]|nr:MAG: hypothetical protein JSW49_08175 [candidate division WOR-3 bacterium]
MKRKVFDLPASDFGWQVARDIFFLVCLLAMSFYAVYFASEDASRVFFLSLLIFFVLSKKDYFWFAFFFIIAQGPGHLFADLSAASSHRLPFYTFLAGMSFTPIDLFVLVALAKSLTLGKKATLRLRKPLFLLLLYIAFTLIVTSTLYGTDIDVVAWNIRWLFYYSVILSFYYLMNGKKDVYLFAILVFPVVLFIFFTQVHFLVTGNEFVNLFSPGYRSLTLIVLTGSIRPMVGGILILFLCYFFSILLLVDKEHVLPRTHIYLIAAVALLSVFVSATRQWFVVFSFMFLGYALLIRKKILSTLGILASILIVVGALTYFSVIPSDTLLHGSWLRIQEVLSLTRGDISAIGTAQNRFVNQLPILLGVIKRNPVIGYGFSNTTMVYYDNDLGFVNTILIFGIIGFLLHVNLFVHIFMLLLKSAKKIGAGNTCKGPLRVLALAWAGLLLIYLTTQDFFAFYFNKVFFVSVLIVFTEYFARKALNEELYGKAGKVLNGTISGERWRI